MDQAQQRLMFIASPAPHRTALTLIDADAARALAIDALIEGEGDQPRTPRE